MNQTRGRDLLPGPPPEDERAGILADILGACQRLRLERESFFEEEEELLPDVDLPRDADPEDREGELKDLEEVPEERREAELRELGEDSVL